MPEFDTFVCILSMSDSSLLSTKLKNLPYYYFSKLAAMSSYLIWTYTLVYKKTWMVPYFRDLSYIIALEVKHFCMESNADCHENIHADIAGCRV